MSFNGGRGPIIRGNAFRPRQNHSECLPRSLPDPVDVTDFESLVFSIQQGNGKAELRGRIGIFGRLAVHDQSDER